MPGEVRIHDTIQCGTVHSGSQKEPSVLSATSSGPVAPLMNHRRQTDLAAANAGFSACMLRWWTMDAIRNVS